MTWLRVFIVIFSAFSHRIHVNLRFFFWIFSIDWMINMSRVRCGKGNEWTVFFTDLLVLVTSDGQPRTWPPFMIHHVNCEKYPFFLSFQFNSTEFIIISFQNSKINAHQTWSNSHRYSIKIITSKFSFKRRLIYFISAHSFIHSTQLNSSKRCLAIHTKHQRRIKLINLRKLLLNLL